MKPATIICAALLCCSVTLASGVAAAADKKPLTICGTTWGKLSGDHLPNKGFVPDLVTRVLNHAGYEVTTKLVPGPKCIQDTKTMKFDIVSTAWRGENFDPHFDYMDIVLIDTINFIVSDNSPIASGKAGELLRKACRIRARGRWARSHPGDTPEHSAGQGCHSRQAPTNA